MSVELTTPNNFPTLINMNTDNIVEEPCVESPSSFL